MAADRKTSLLILALALALLPFAAGLQVSAGSPCASFCLDPGLDSLDAAASNTRPSEITCNDDDFTTTEKGMKYQRCLTCLQDSDYISNEESDQEWFLYNLRYSFSYCMFGFPNATGIPSTPCITSEACGPLEPGFKEGLIDPSRAEPYDYCSSDATGSILGDNFDRCVQCVHSGNTRYLSNFLVALEAGCRQQPVSGVVVGLNDTVFNFATIGIVDPNAADEIDTPGGLSTPIMVAIIVGCVVVVLLGAGCTYMQLRKRRNRARRSQVFDRPLASPMSFRCQTRVTPLDAEFPGGVHSEAEKPYADPAAALNSNPISGAFVRNSLSRPSSAKLPSITTTAIPVPQPAFSPSQRMSPDDYNTPISTTSTHSNAPLLHHKPYVPSEYGNSPPQMSTPFFTQGPAALSPRQSSYSNNRLVSFAGQREMSPVSPWEDQTLIGNQRNLTSRKSPVLPGTPVESMPIKVSFPPPPKR